MSPPRPSSALILHRRGKAGELEVFLVKRSEHLRFFAGYLAFPGGAVDPGDADLPMRGAIDGAGRDLVGCAARELFEETGILAAAPGVAGSIAGKELEGLRAALAADGAPADAFGRFLADHSLAIDASLFVPAARFITPSFSALRFDTTFFMLESPGEPHILEGELESGSWRAPRDILDEWERGDVRVAAPVVTILEALASKPPGEALEELRSIPPEFEGSGRTVRSAPGYDLLPLETPPLPPAIPTNTFLVGLDTFIVVDPAPRSERGRQHLRAAIDGRISQGHRLLAVVLTHHHPDHVGALDDVLSRREPPPLWAHPLTGELLGRSLDRRLDDGAEIDLGRGPGGLHGWRIRALFTPGHAEGHIALHDERTASVIAGDLVSTLVSMYVGSPGGDLRQYMASLERLRSLGARTLYPSHGAPTHDVEKLLADTIQHRRRRIEEALAALSPAPRSVESLAAAIYPDANPKLRPLIVRATRAALENLAQDGLAENCGGDQYRRK